MQTADPRAGSYQTCRYFDNSSRTFEREFAGLTSFSSGVASVRDADGICILRERHLKASSYCGLHVRSV